MSWRDTALELWALALSSVRWIRLVKHGVEPTDLFRQVQPDRAGVCLNPPGRTAWAGCQQAAWTQPRGSWWAGGWARHTEALSGDWSFRAVQAKLIQPWPQVFKIKDSTGASAAKRKRQSSESVTQKLQVSFKNMLQAICLQSHGKSVAGWKYNVDIHLPALCFNNKAVAPRYAAT